MLFPKPEQVAEGEFIARDLLQQLLLMLKRTIPIALLVFGCNSFANKDKADAHGYFEMQEYHTYAESSGRILQMNLEEGMRVDSGQMIGWIDTANCVQQIKKCYAQMQWIESSKPAFSPELNVKLAEGIAQSYRERALAAKVAANVKDQGRYQRLFKADATTGKQLDDANRDLEIVQNEYKAAQAETILVKKKIKAHQQLTEDKHMELESQKSVLREEIALLHLQKRRCQIQGIKSGIVTLKKAKEGEWVSTGELLFVVTDYSRALLSVYVKAELLNKIHIGQSVKVDVGNEQFPGRLTWISDRAEFNADKVITGDDYSDLVYEVKIGVSNIDQKIKRGQYAEVQFF